MNESRFLEASKLAASPDALCSPIGEELAILHQTKNHYLSLNETGTFLWQMLEEGLSFVPLLERFQSEFELSEDQAKKDLLQFLTEMDNQDLLLLQ